MAIAEETPAVPAKELPLRWRDPQLWKMKKESRQAKKDVIRQKAARNGHKLGSFYRWKKNGSERFRQQVCKRCGQPTDDIIDEKCKNPRLRGQTQVVAHLDEVQDLIDKKPVEKKPAAAKAEKKKPEKANGVAAKKK